jgi:hypothetical protein
MKSFFEFYQVLKTKQLLEQDMGMAPTAPQVGAAAPDFSANQMAPAAPTAPAAAPQAGGMPPAPQAGGQANMDVDPSVASPTGDEQSNVAPSEGELDTEQLDASIETIRSMIPNLKSQDEDAGANIEEVLNQLSNLLNSALGRNEEPQGEEGQEGQEGEAPASDEAGVGMPGGLEGMDQQASQQDQTSGMPPAPTGNMGGV